MDSATDQSTSLGSERPRDADTTLLSSVFERLPLVVLLNSLVALATVLVFAGRRPSALLAGWLLFMLLTLAVRMWSWHARRKSPPDPATTPRWARHLTLGAGATGLAWGLGGVLLYDPAGQVSLIFMPFIMAGMIAGSVTALTGHMPAYTAFSACMLVPYALRMIAEGDRLHLIMATLTLLYLVGMGLLARRVNASMVAAVRLGAENEELVAALREKSAQLEATFDNVNQGVAVFDRDGRLATWNPRHRELHGYPAGLYRRGGTVAEFLHHDGAGRGAGDREAAGAVAPGRWASAVPARFEQAGADGRTLEVERSPMPGGGFVSTSTDITERKRAEARMLHLAQHDALTGLPNRLLFNDRLQQAMARCRRQGTLMAVILLDLNKFKQVNDAFGHPVGDAVLQQAAARLRSTLRASDTVARIGGDEFAFILQELPDVHAATTIADKLVGRLGEPFALAGGDWQLRASLGVALFPSAGEDAEQLVRSADQAMYRAKAAGGGFELAVGAPAADGGERQGLEHDLGRAIERSELMLEYQPQLDLDPERISGVEALLRWRHPQFGAIGPENLIRLAETSGLIGPISEWALYEACTCAARWPLDGAPIRVAVNLAASQLVDRELTALVRRVLDASGLPAGRLELELTERCMLTQIDRITSNLAALHELGVALALDDFGTGFASISHLRQLPLDTLKIDRSFVAQLGAADAAPDEAIVRSLVELGHRLSLRVIAEGVESQPSSRRSGGSAAMRSRAIWSAGR